MEWAPGNTELRRAGVGVASESTGHCRWLGLAGPTSRLTLAVTWAIQARRVKLTQCQWVVMDGLMGSECGSRFWSRWFLWQKIRQLPMTLGRWLSLHVLDVSNNLLTSIPGEIGSLLDLQQLSLSNNQLTKLPVEFRFLTSLSRLDLSHNRLTAFTTHLYRFTLLTDLDLSHNRLQVSSSRLLT